MNKEQAIVLVSTIQNYGTKQFRVSVRMIAARLLALPSHIKVHPSRVEQSARDASYLLVE